MKPPNLLCQDGHAARDFRLRLGLNQAQFWARVGIGQSGGSRYESGRLIPVQVLWALHLSYGTDKQADALLKWLRRVG